MLIAGNWKMFKGPNEAATFCRELRSVEIPDDVDAVVCPPFVSLADAVQALAGTEIGVFAQNCHWADEGAFTGEVSASMLLELGVYGAIVGHSERRQLFGETDATVARRVEAGLDAGLAIIACVGETETEREAGETEAVLRSAIERRETRGAHVRDDYPAADASLARANVVIRGKAGSLEPVVMPRAEPPEELRSLAMEGAEA